MMNKKILIVAAHPDDEILGCGATIAKLTKQGHQAYTIILGEGITSRDNSRDTELRKSEISSLKEQIKKANNIIGVNECYSFDFPDNRFDSVPLLDIVKKIENVKNNIKPDIIFTHYEKDLNIDHRITYQAVITATRPIKGETVKEIYSFEVLSSTEWSYPLSFSPNTFFDVSDTIDLKKQAMSEYSEELKEYPHPRSLDGIYLNSKIWGMKVGLDYSEAFICVRKTIL